MARFLISGGKPLKGRVRISGRKNSALAVLPAALLFDGVTTLENLPDINDVSIFGTVMEVLGARITRTASGAITVDPRGLLVREAPYELVKKLRASYYLLGVFLARFGQANVALPGGDDIGPRPVDQHLKGFRALGAEVTIDHGVIRARAERLRGAKIYLDVVSVGATVNLMLAACLAEGTTVIENAAKEPHIVDLANFLNAGGANILGAGTDVIKIKGVKSLQPCTHAIIPDDIEAATYMIAAAATRGDVVLENVIPKHLEPVVAKLRETGAEIWENGDQVRVVGIGRPQAVNVKTLPYPGFPTDAQPPMSALLSVAEGTSLVSEGIWEGRFRFMDELKRMGASIRVEGRTAIIEGVDRLEAAPTTAGDLRAGAALVVAGLMAEGETSVYGIEHMERGYERAHEKLRALGADIVRED